jgi:hypothetical protein
MQRYRWYDVPTVQQVRRNWTRREKGARMITNEQLELLKALFASHKETDAILRESGRLSEYLSTAEKITEALRAAIATIEALPVTRDDDRGEHNEILDASKVFRTQWREAKGDGQEITCPCGTRAPVRFLFRCLYCGVWFCQSCAEVHFGKKRSDVSASPAMATPWDSSVKNAELAARDGHGGGGDETVIRRRV